MLRPMWSSSDVKIIGRGKCCLISLLMLLMYVPSMRVMCLIWWVVLCLLVCCAVCRVLEFLLSCIRSVTPLISLSLSHITSDNIILMRVANSVWRFGPSMLAPSNIYLSSLSYIWLSPPALGTF
jgi:hypothetical protein